MAKRKPNKLIERATITPRQAVDMDRERRMAVTKHRTLQAKYEETQRRIEQLEAENELLTRLGKRLQTKAWHAPPKSGKSEATAGIVFSDWHVGEVVEPDSVNGANEYNPGIAEQRAKAVTERALIMIDDARNLANVSTVVVHLLGDFITGWIHPENEQTNALTPPEEMMFAAELLEASIKTIVKRCGCKKIIVPTCVGNHGRITHKTQAANRTRTSYEQAIYHSLARRCNDSRITWDIGKAYERHTVVGTKVIRSYHGDSIKYQGGIGGMAIPVIKSIHRRNQRRRADFDVFGHLHDYTPAGYWLCNGSLIGYNAYAATLGLPYQDPLQSFYLMDHARGMVRVTQLFTD